MLNGALQQMDHKKPIKQDCTPLEKGMQELFNLPFLHMDRRLYSDDSQVREAVNLLCTAIEGLRIRRKMKLASYKATRRFLNCLLINFFDALFTGKDYHLAVKLGKDDYYEADYPYQVVRNAMAGLESLGYVVGKGHAYDPVTDTGLVSRFKATGKLTALMAGWSLGVIKQSERRPLVEIRAIGKIRRQSDAEGKKCPTYRWPNSLRTHRAQAKRNLKFLNKALHAQFQSLAIPDDGENDPQTPDKFSLRTALGKSKKPVKLRRHSLHRIYQVDPETEVFDNEHGGRFYGPWWQQVKKELRPFIRMAAPGYEPQETVEVDFESLHPTMLYAMCGVPVTGDLYAIYENVFINKTLRKVIKVLMLTLINADSESDAKNSFKSDLNTEMYPEWLENSGFEPEDVTNPFENVDAKLAVMFRGCPTLNQLVKDIKTAHPQIAKYFGSGEGRKLMWQDSLMAELVMMSMYRQHGIVPLPNHDSFIVPCQYEAALRKTMEDVFAARWSNIKPSTTITRLKYKPHSLDDSALYSKLLAQWQATPALTQKNNKLCIPANSAPSPLGG